MIVETEIDNKHRMKCKIKDDIAITAANIKSTLSFFEHKALLYKLRNLVGKREKKWKATQEKKLRKLREDSRTLPQEPALKYLPSIVHNFSSYVLSKEESESLAYGLDHYIPANIDKRRLEVEFEDFYQSILWNTKDLPENAKLNLKTKFLSTFQNYKKIKAPYDHRETIKKLSTNKDIMLLKQDKGRGIVIMDRTKYIDKCMDILNTDKFMVLNDDPTAQFESRVQTCLRSMKKRLDLRTYNSIYPTSSRPGQFYGTAKLHKIPKDSTDVEPLPIRPIISNIGTATYRTSKYIAKLLAPLTKSKYTVDSTKDFIDHARKMKIGNEFEMVSFDVSNLFTNVPLEYTINLILDKVYKKKLIKTKLKRNELKLLLELCTKEMHFTFNGKVYKQVDGVCMGSPLGPVLANIFMVELEETIAPKLQSIMPVWRRYVDDTFTFVKKNQIANVIDAINSFHPNIKFTHEIEKDGKIAFLDVLLMRKDTGNIETSVYRKPTNNSIYIHWNAYGPRQWKVGTLSGIIRRAYDICSTDESRTSELKFIADVFTQINGYPQYVVNSMLNKFEEKHKDSTNSSSNADTTTGDDDKKDSQSTLMLKLPFRGEKGETLIRSLNKTLKRNVPDTEYRIVHTGTKLSRHFSLKDSIDKKHQSNFVYRHECQNKKCDLGDYVGETARRREKRCGEDHSGKDKNSHIFLHSKTTKHPRAKEKDFEVLASNYPNRRKRRLCEAMYIRDLKPKLNKKKDSYKLQLFG